MHTLFAERLKKLRMDKNISQVQLAEQMFVTQSTVARWENGSRLPDAIMISRLSKLLDVDVHALLFAAAQFVYFQFIDHGFLIANYTTMMNTPEFLDAMKIYGLKEDDIKLVMQNMGAMRPIDNALQFFTTNVFIGAFISVPVALLMRREPGNSRFYHNNKRQS